MAKQVLEKVPFKIANNRIILSIDQSKNKEEIERFNNYLARQIEHLKPRTVPLDIFHLQSEEDKDIQCADMFCWGIFRKYERRDLQWYDIFEEKIKFETIFLPEK